jgi:hypothetical protein
VDTTAHLQVLKRTGLVLLVVGLVDMAVMVYCIANSISYSSSFNVFAVVAGVFLLRGSLRAASVVRWFSMFLLAGFLSLFVAWPYLQPIDLILTRFRLDRGSAVTTAALGVFVVGLLAWLYAQLGSASLLAARLAAGRPRRDMRIPAAAGIGLVILVSVFLSFLLGGESANKAKAVAAQQLGPAYRYHVSSLNIRKSNRGTFVSGVVTAWNDKEIRDVPVQWEER